ncbi:MAG: hypothetical protein KDI02_13540, partial [Anaerolineae bacterium]|nr:hypothetical protein [Anaerolineae bacterium]
MIYTERKLAAEMSPRYLGRIINYFAGINLSIRTKILLSFLVVVALMGSVNTVLIMQVLNFNRQYDAIIDNITTANSING